MSAPSQQRPLMPSANDDVDPQIPRLRGRTPIAPDEVRLSVLIPVYNEQNTIRIIVEQVRSVPVRTEIVCVNDCSTDDSRAILDQLHAEGLIDIVVHKEHNEGKGAAIRTALQRSSGPFALPTRMTPSRFHVPPRPGDVVASVRAGPPERSIRLTLLSAKNPIDRLSGDQNG